MIASAAVVTGGERDADCSSSTDDGDAAGELINLLDVVVDVADSSTESQTAADCILNALHTSPPPYDERIITRYDSLSNLFLHVLLLSRIRLTRSSESSTREMVATDRQMTTLRRRCGFICEAPTICRGVQAAARLSLSITAPSRRSIGWLSLPGRCAVDAA